MAASRNYHITFIGKPLKSPRSKTKTRHETIRSSSENLAIKKLRKENHVLRVTMVAEVRESRRGDLWTNKRNPLAQSRIGSNMTEVRTDEMTVLFSYKTPVAAFVRGEGWFKTEKKWSSTTSRHINKWLRNNNVLDLVQERPQSFFDELIK